MSSNRLKHFHRTLSFRLSLWFGVIFTASVAVLFLISYLLLSFFIERNDREIVQDRARQYAAIYQAGGVSGLRAWMERSDEAPRQKLFVRIVSPLNAVLFISAPGDWVELDPNWLKFGVQRGWVRIPKDAERDLTIASVNLFDGSALQVGRVANSREVFLQPFRRIFLLAAVPLIFLAFVGGVAFAHRSTRPIRQVVETARFIIETGDLGERVSVGKTGDELEELANLFNRLLEKNQRLIRGMRDSLDNVAHDLRTPLARLRGTAEAALRESGNETVSREALADCVEESDRVLTMLKTLLDVAEAEAGVMNLNRERINLIPLLREVSELYEFVAEERKIQVALNLPKNCEALADGARLRQVFANLLDNALKYTSEGGRVVIEAQSTDKEAVITFRDTGVGIPLDEQNKIWERLYRGDKSRAQRGLGLGLSLVKAVVEAHKGTVGVRSVEGQGSEFTIRLLNG